jgi:transposase
MPKTRPPYPEEFRREAVALIRSGQRSLAEASRSLGVSRQTLRTSLKREDVDAGRTEGVTGEEREELRRLRREVRVLREEREIRIKQPPSSSRRTRPGSCVPVHRGGEGEPRHRHDLPGARGLAVGLLRGRGTARRATLSASVPSDSKS